MSCWVAKRVTAVLNLDMTCDSRPQWFAIFCIVPFLVVVDVVVPVNVVCDGFMAVVLCDSVAVETS